MTATAALDLASMSPGPEFAAALASVDPSSLAGGALVEFVAAEYRQLAHQQARVFAAMAHLEAAYPTPFDAADPRGPHLNAADEIRAELRITRHAAQAELALAVRLAADLPAVLDALREGRIDRAKARVFAEQTSQLAPAQVGVVVRELLPRAARCTATDLASRIRRLAIALDPEWAERRYRIAVRSARVVGFIAEDGSATITGSGLPADQAAAAVARIDELARSIKAAGCRRGADAIRADLFLGFLDGTLNNLSRTEIISQFTDDGGEISGLGHGSELRTGPELRTGVELRVELSTLAGLDDHPAEIAGLGQVIAAVARKVAAAQTRGAQWRFAVLDTDGHLLTSGITGRRPRGFDGRCQGGVVELHVHETLLREPDAWPGAWRGVLTDVADQHRAATESIPAESTAAGSTVAEGTGAESDTDRDDEGRRRRFAGAALKRHIQIRDRTCTFPTCRTPARRTDHDHITAHGHGGDTVEANLGSACRVDHPLRHRRGWQVRIDDGVVTWTSPLGRVHPGERRPVNEPLPAPLPRDDDPQVAMLNNLDTHGDSDGPDKIELTSVRRRLPKIIEQALAPKPATAPDDDPDPPPF